VLTTVDKVLLLMRTPVTAALATDALSRLATVAHEHELSQGLQLFGAGEAAASLWVIVDGAVRVESGEATTRLAEAGDVVGGLVALVGGVHGVSASALVPSRVLRIDRQDLHELLDEDGELARLLFAGLLRALAARAPASLDSV
jgi:CRP-like cAMP-binding protein